MHPTSNSRLIRLRELRGLIHVSTSTIFRWERGGNFPSRIKIGPNTVAWRLSDIEEWIAGKIGQACGR